MNCHTIEYETLDNPGVVVGGIGTCEDSLLQVQGKGMVTADKIVPGDVLVMSYGAVRVTTITAVDEE